MQLSTLRRSAESLLSELARAELEQASRSGHLSDFAGIFAHHSDLSSTEAFDFAREALANASDDAGRASARRLLELAAVAAEGRATSSLLQQKAEFDARTEIRFDGDLIPVLEVPRRIMSEPERERRVLLARLRDASYAALDDTLARRVSECIELAGRLGFPSYEGLLSESSGIDLAALGAEAEALLRSSEDAYRDLMSFALRRSGSRVSLRPHGEAVAADLERYSRLERLDDVFRTRRLVPVARGLFEGIGLSPNADGRIALDVDPRASGSPVPLVAAVEVPFEIAVVVRPVGGARDFLGLFEALGRAQHLAAIHPDLPFEDRRLGDASLVAGYGALFERLAIDDGFLRRSLDADPHDALEAARFVAIELLRRLRHDCARLVYQRALYREGPAWDLRGLYRETMGKALMADWPVEPWLYDVEARMQPARRLRAMALEPVLRDWLRDRANEDWWRNPRAGALLKPQFSRGQRDDAAAVAKELGGALSLERAAARLIETASR